MLTKGAAKSTPLWQLLNSGINVLFHCIRRDVKDYSDADTASLDVQPNQPTKSRVLSNITKPSAQVKYTGWVDRFKNRQNLCLTKLFGTEI